MSTEPLAAAASRTTLHSELGEAVAHAGRTGEPVSVLVVDIDYFKSINDAFGHTRGDQVLDEFVARLQGMVRRSDRVLRYGGDEFVVVLEGTPRPRAEALAVRLLQRVRERPFPGEPPVSLSLSVGVAGTPADTLDPQGLFEAADRRLLSAKRRGRGQVVADELPPLAALGPAGSSLAEARLLEREAALEALHRFLGALPEARCGLLAVEGAAGAGRTRFLAEAARVARMRGFEVLPLAGSETLFGAPFGVLAAALKGWMRQPPALEAPALRRALAEIAQERGAAGLVILADDARMLDPGTREVLRDLLAAPDPDLPPTGLVAVDAAELGAGLDGTPAGHLRLEHTPTPPHPHTPTALAGTPAERLRLEPLSPEGVRVWLRNVLHWEPPPALVDALHGQTGGLPARLCRALARMVDASELVPVGGDWQVRLPAGPAPAPPAVPVPPASPGLPVVLTRFVGREAEIGQVARHLARHRLVTLLGPSGIGKTRLALQVAARLAGTFRDGVHFVPLAPVTESEGVLDAVAQALDVRETGDRALAEAVRERLSTRAALLVLDNFEQVTAAAPLVGTLLTAAPHVRILVTSRTALRIYGEHELPVPPLPLPSLDRLPEPEGLAEVASVALFLERARAARPAFALTPENARAVAEICVRLDGLPLAIELAAARSRVLSPQEMLPRLNRRLVLLTGGARDLPSRQQTLRGAIDWSYDLLQPDERRLFARFAVFPSACSLEALEAVLGGDPALPPLEGVERLLDKSLVRAEEGPGGELCFRMLETIREYALERLAASGEEEAVRRAHARHFLGVVERGETELRGPQQTEWLARLERDHDHLRAALRWAVASGDAEIALRLAGALWRFWFTRGHFREGRTWLETVLGMEREAPPSGIRGKALYGAGVMAMCQGDYTVSDARLRECLLCQHTAGSTLGVAQALLNLGNLAHYQGDDRSARPFYEESLVLFRELDDPWGVAGALNNLADLATDAGDWAGAAALHAESLALRRRDSDTLGIAESLGNLGFLACRQGDFARAESLRRESLRIYHAHGTLPYLASSFSGLALIAAGRKQHRRAVRLYGAAEALRQALAAPRPRSDRAYQDTLSALRAELGPAAFQAAWEEGAALGPDEAVAYALGESPERGQEGGVEGPAAPGEETPSGATP